MIEFLIGGVDEAGRGPLAGPVYAAAVVLAPSQKIAGVADSKLLSAERRAELSVTIRAEAVSYSIGWADVAEIDSLNILHASLLAMRRAVETLSIQPHHLQIDGNRAPKLPAFGGSVETVVGGDRLCAVVSAASILAKVSRDEFMIAMHERYPDYGFATHKGYATSAHRAALVQHGPCPEHRKSFALVRDALSSRHI